MNQQLRAAVCALIIGLATTAANPTWADDANAQTAAFSMPTPDEVVDIMAAKLALSTAQRTQLAPLIADRQQKMKAILADSESRPMARRRQAKEVMALTDKKINAILSPEQQQQYAQLEQQMRELLQQRMQDNRHGASY